MRIEVFEKAGYKKQPTLENYYNFYIPLGENTYKYLVRISGAGALSQYKCDSLQEFIIEPASKKITLKKFRDMLATGYHKIMEAQSSDDLKEKYPETFL